MRVGIGALSLVSKPGLGRGRKRVSMKLPRQRWYPSQDRMRKGSRLQAERKFQAGQVCVERGQMWGLGMTSLGLRTICHSRCSTMDPSLSCMIQRHLDGRGEVVGMGASMVGWAAHTGLSRRPHMEGFEHHLWVT